MESSKQLEKAPASAVIAQTDDPALPSRSRVEADFQPNPARAGQEFAPSLPVPAPGDEASHPGHSSGPSAVEAVQEETDMQPISDQSSDLENSPSEPEYSSIALVKRLVADGSPEAYLEIVHVINALPEGPERRAALVAVPQLENPETVALLLETVRVSGDPELVQAAQIGLGNMTNEAVVWMAVALYRGTDDAGQRERLLGVLKHAGQDSFANALMAVADQNVADSDPLLVRAAIDTLGYIGTTDSVSYIVQRLNAAADAGEDTTELVASLGRVMKPAALPVLISAASGIAPDTRSETRLTAIRALGHYEWESVGPTLTGITQFETDPQILKAAQEAMNLSKGNYPSDFSDEL